MEPEFEVEVYPRRGVLGKKWYWRLRSTANGQVVAGSRGGLGSGYANSPECAKMVDRIFEGRWPTSRVEK
jgi:hypothetical protein